MPQIITPQGTLAFPFLAKPRPGLNGGEDKYSCILIFSPAAQATPEFKAMRAAVNEAAVKKFGADKMNTKAFAEKVRLPFRKGDEMSDKYAGFDDADVWVNFSTKDRPKVLDGSLQEMMPADVWAGQLARAAVSAFGYDVSGNRGVSLGLNHLQVTKRNMPRIDGRVAAEKSFGIVEDDSDGMIDDDDPTR